jgi:hypothetical protein
MSDDSLSALLGSYDNLNEPLPMANKRETVLGVTVTCIVRNSPNIATNFQATNEKGWTFLIRNTAIIVGVRHVSILHEIFRDLFAWFG